MRISEPHIKALKELLKEEFRLDYSDEEAQEAGLAIMRFALAKELRAVNKQPGHDNQKRPIQQMRKEL